jgi:alpha,alpha-trehalase
VYALRRIGLLDESRSFLRWALDAIDRDGRPRVVYDIDGRPVEEEVIDPDLEGYRASAPVRFGNAAGEQVQHDVYGEILDCAWQWARHGGEIEPRLWARLRPLIDDAATAWRTPDHGIWEVRTSGRPFTYSAAMCQVALDRGARLAEAHGLPGRPAAWRAASEEILRTILRDAWDPAVGALSESIGAEGGLDASLLALPLRRVVPADDPRMVATAEAIVERLGAGQGLVYRYLPRESPDGLPGEEGAFLLCSFWLADNLVGQGRLEEAHDLFASLCARGGTLGLLSEQIDPADGSFLGNHPQAFSHVGLISTALNLARAERGERRYSSARSTFT